MFNIIKPASNYLTLPPLVHFPMREEQRENYRKMNDKFQGGGWPELSLLYDPAQAPLGKVLYSAKVRQR